MYGTVMIARRRGSLDEWWRVADEWLDRRVPGFVREETILADDGATVVMAVFFESKEDYLRLAGDSTQDEWYRERLAPLLDGEPRWIDGEWQEALVART